MNQKAILDWYITSGVTETIGLTPTNRFLKPTLVQQSIATPQNQAPQNTLSFSQTSTLVQQASSLAQQAQNLSDLHQKLISFDACSLNKTATNTFIGVGQTNQPLVACIFDAPRSDADRENNLFAGEIGMRLQNMLKAIHLDLQNTFVVPLLPWRLPGDRTPRDTEIQMCLPILKRQLELTKPSFLLCLTGIACQALFDLSLPKARQQNLLFDLSSTLLPARATFGPEALGTSCANSSREKAWLDLQNFEKFVKENKTN